MKDIMLRASLKTCFVLCFFLSNTSIKSNVIHFDAHPPSHQLWNTLLAKHVAPDGSVDYEGFITDQEKLNVYLESLQTVHPNNDWSENSRKAYWINAYNAFTVKLVIDHYPVESIKDIGGLIKSPFDIDFITIEHQTYDLNAIEHKILRAEFDDPRIHFAINCASVSCPKLLNKAYMPDKLDQQLDKRAKDFINNPSKNADIKYKDYDWSLNE
jgi:hypothetical protein